MERCGWVGADPLYEAYHDAEWGVPERDGRALWEALMLEGFQAGLSWIIILRKREGFHAAFAGFDPEAVARLDADDVDRLLSDPGIVRHRGKIEATVRGARVFLALGGSAAFRDLCWSYVDGTPLQPRRASMAEVPARTDLSARIAKDFKRLGFGFCGPTAVYAWMQAVGLVNDHVVGCGRHATLAGSKAGGVVREF